MDVTDIATAYEEVELSALISNQRRASNPILERRRQHLADVRAIAAQRGLDDPEVQSLRMECLNECGELLPLVLAPESEADVTDSPFCCKECAEDWEARERARRIAGNR